MASPLVKAGTDTVTNDVLNDFLALTNLEQQAFFLLSKLASAQNAFNATSPPTPVNRFVISPNFNARQVNAQGVFALSDNAVIEGLVAGTQSAGISAVKLAAEAGDTVTNADLNALLALATLEKQAVHLAAKLSSLENAYNTANPATQINRVSITTNYDGNSATVVLALPMSSTAILPASVVEAYL